MKNMNDFLNMKPLSKFENGNMCRVVVTHNKDGFETDEWSDLRRVLAYTDDGRVITECRNGQLLLVDVDRVKLVRDWHNEQ